jgi:hypothetical protein
MQPVLDDLEELEEDVSPSPSVALVREWRAEQLERLGITRIVAQAFADIVDWHELARVVGLGCPPELALEIVR